MEQSIKIETFSVSFRNHLWAEQGSIMLVTLVGVIAIYAQFSVKLFFELLLGGFIFTGIVLMNFVAIALHIYYYFSIDRNKKVEMYTDRMVIYKDGKFVEQILKNDIERIILLDKIHPEGNFRFWNSDIFYYLTIIGKNRERIVLTCLLNIKLKKKMAAWYGKEIEHKYQFFPFP